MFIMKHDLANMKRKRERVSYLFVLGLFLKNLFLIYVQFHVDLIIFFPPLPCISVEEDTHMTLGYCSDCTVSHKSDKEKLFLKCREEWKHLFDHNAFHEHVLIQENVIRYNCSYLM